LNALSGGGVVCFRQFDSLTPFVFKASVERGERKQKANVDRANLSEENAT
jgi:hypothetical protein